MKSGEGAFRFKTKDYTQRSDSAPSGQTLRTTLAPVISAGNLNICYNRYQKLAIR